jgi:hypothetical protein
LSRAALAPPPFVAKDGGGLVKTPECRAVSPFLATVIGYSSEAKPPEPPLVPLECAVSCFNPGPDQPLEVKGSAPLPFRTMPDQYAAVSRSPKNAATKTAKPR